LVILDLSKALVGQSHHPTNSFLLVFYACFLNGFFYNLISDIDLHSCLGHLTFDI
jgi:hypothetical protein